MYAIHSTHTSAHIQIISITICRKLYLQVYALLIPRKICYMVAVFAEKSEALHFLRVAA